MFGNLFNENGSQTTELSVVSTIPPPPGHRSEYGLAGIDNQGATCYLNSLLQTLFLTPEFRDRLFSLSEGDLGSLQDRDKPNAKVRVIPLQLQRLFAQLLLSDQQSVSTADLTNSFGWTNREEFQQHDVQELNRILFSAIEESLVGTSGQNIINELYHGTIVNQITCSKCKKISEREEDFLDLTLAVAGTPGLETALKQCYCHVEVMDGQNKYRCETCKEYTDAIKGAKLRNLPPLLTLSLLRFSFDVVKMTRYKENGRFTFPLELDMGPYSEKDSLKDADTSYELFSVVVHRGSAFGGHYFAYIRDIDNIGHWVQPEKNIANGRVDTNATGLDVIECQSPVDLIENILGKVSHNAMSIDRLCAEISKETGVSWNKRFKKVHGPINKFLKSCDSFDYNQDSNWVSLRNSGSGQGAAQKKSSEVKASAGNVSSDDPSETNTNSSGGQNSEPCDRWFCFNDSTVYPVYAKDIERQFSGKESAYMLFYRRKSLHRPIEAQGLASYNIPAYLIHEVDELNVALEKQRQNYEIEINSITVKVYMSESFIYDGLLQLKPDLSADSAFFTVDLDKRMAYRQLKAKIQEVLSQFDIHTFSVHRMKSRCGGYHLYDELIDEDCSIQDMGINSFTLLFVWNGYIMDDKCVDVGEQCEPLQFLVKTSDDRVMCYLILAKNKTLTDLYETVASTTELDVQCLQWQENETKPAEVLPNSPTTCLGSAGLKDGDILVLSSQANSDSKSDEASTSSPPQDGISDPEWSITLQSRLFQDGCNATKSITFFSKASSTVMDVKLRALHLLNADNISPESVRLREEHRTLGLQPPLREGLCMADAGLSNGVCLVIEHGRSPVDSEMMISINKVESGKLVCKKEFIVERHQTALDMTRAACQIFECSGTQWYLSKTDVYGDPVEPLDDLAATLIDLLINDGDTLILQQGPVIKKDQVSLTVYLAPVQPMQVQIEPGTNGSGDDFRQEEEDKVILEMAARMSLSANGEINILIECLFPCVEVIYDSLVINKSMSVEELKQGLMGTDKFQALRIPTCNFMRLRVLEALRLRSVLRTNSQVLRHTNSKESIPLAVQILNSEENLGVHEILLMVTLKIGSTRIYRPPHEFIWNTSGGVGAADLKKAIASRLSLPLHDVLIAKYCPETFSWQVLKDQPPKQNKGKNKKKSGHKTNLRQAPYYVQDGDLIGVKLLSVDKGFLDAEDFATQEDLDKQKLLEQLAEEKKRIREERKHLQGADGFPVVRRPEVPLTIKVDKFS
ncbi:unnamed protein product [Lymnaea stagnalis]|uniref:USP domain-containing protein n=1 Tax=Lymnaea stagnalis TaxID=6523 RepID=A0AAV2H173_LYMST